MLFSSDWLQEYVRLPKPRELERLLAMHAFEVEEVKKYRSGWLFDVAVLPNRTPDAANHAGLAREIAALSGESFTPPEKTSIKTQKGSLKPLKIEVRSSSLVPRYKAVLLEGVSMRQSPKWVRERLEAVGVNSINAIVDLTNYVMLETGQPLHAFDYDAIRGKTMRVRIARKGERITTLDGQTLQLQEGMLVIEDGKGLIDLAGIKGGKASGVSSNTKNVLLQAATFDGPAIYRTRKQLGYTTQAADLYAAGLDPNAAQEGLERALHLLGEFGGGTVVQTVDLYPRKAVPRSLKLDLEYLNSLLGVSVPENEVASILKRLGFETKRQKGALLVRVPTRRRDVKIAEDLIEEVGRVYGYEHIPAVFPASSLQPHERNLHVFWKERVRDMFKEAGLTETYSYSFIGEQDKKLFSYTSEKSSRLVELENPMSEEIKYPRPGLLENLLRSVAANRKRTEALSLFEIGTVYEKKQGKPAEEERVAGVVQNGSFYGIKGIVEFLLNGLGIADVRFFDRPRDSEAVWHGSRVAEVKVGNASLGLVGEISGLVRGNLKLRNPVAAFSLDMGNLARLASEEQEFQPLSRFPATIRDIALLVPRDVKVADVLDTINAAGGRLVRDVDLFDMLEGGSLPEGMKNLAFHIIYQSEERTLTGKEVNALQEKIVSALESVPSWQVRT